MPQIEVKTVASEQVWKSPDGQRVISKVTLDYNGNQVTAKTYSNDIAKEGWSGTVETYEKQGRNGSETFVKQPPKEGGYPSQGGSQQSYGSGKPMNGGKRDFDNFTMYLSYAKDLVAAHITAQTKDGSALTLDDSVAATIQYGTQLYESRPGAEKPADGKDVVAEVTKDDLNNIDQLFGKDNFTVEGEDEPWPPKES